MIKIFLLHIFGLVGLFLVPSAHNATLCFSFFLSFLTLLGVQVGAHRLWSHRSYKANLFVRTFLCLCHTMSMQNDLYEWCRDHRGHHKWSDTDADPHNAHRGFFFSHMGWLMVRKHPLLIKNGAKLDLSDLLEDPVVRFQRKYIVILGKFANVLPFLGQNRKLPRKLILIKQILMSFFSCNILGHFTNNNSHIVLERICHSFILDLCFISLSTYITCYLDG